MPPMNPLSLSKTRGTYVCRTCLLKFHQPRPVPALQRSLRTNTRTRRTRATRLADHQVPLQDGAQFSRNDGFGELEGDSKKLFESKLTTQLEAVHTKMQEVDHLARSATLNRLRSLHGNELTEDELLRLEAHMYAERQAELEAEVEGDGMEDMDQDELIANFHAETGTLEREIMDPAAEREEEQAELVQMQAKGDKLDADMQLLYPLVNDVKAKDGQVSEEEIAKVRAALEQLYPEFSEDARAWQASQQPHRIEEGPSARATTVHGETVHRGQDVEVNSHQNKSTVLPILDKELATYKNEASTSHTSTSHNACDFPVDESGIQAAYVSHLNAALGEALRLRTRKTLWKGNLRSLQKSEALTFRWYILARQRLLSAPHKIKHGAWIALWDVLCSPGVEDRLARVNYLGSDMLQAGVPLDENQHLLYIEAKHVHGDKAIAIEEWKAGRNSLGNSSVDKIKTDFWCLGVNICSQNGHLDLALQAAEQLFENHTNIEVFRMLVPLIQVCLDVEVKSKATHKHLVQMAWAIYIRMRVRAGSRMSMEDYDDVVAAFMEADKPELALAVFKDMMLAGDRLSDRGEDSILIYEKSVGCEPDLWTISPDQREIAWERSESLAKIPSRYNNKYFFGKWIKKLIGEGELDYASKVLDLMRERSIRPDAIYVNGLIGAWLRLGTARAQELGEALAWQMIAARITYVRQRNAHTWQGTNSVIRGVLSGYNTAAYRSPMGAVPIATIETFSVLIENYRRRQKQELMTEVYDALGTAEIRPNTFFMNQVIMSDQKSHRKDWAWDMYLHCVHGLKLQPDLSTYQALWRIARVIWDPLKARSVDVRGFPNCRGLFAEMIKRSSTLTMKEELSEELLELVIQSFSVGDDQAGTAVAMRALARHFNTYPTDGVVRRLLIQLARVGHATISGLRPRRANFNESTKQRLGQVSRVLASFKKQRVELLREQGIEFDNMEAVAQAEQSLLILSDLLRYVAQMRLDQTKHTGQNMVKDVAELSRIAAEEMGVPDCNPWVDDDLTASTH